MSIYTLTVTNNNEPGFEILNSPEFDLNQEVSLTNEMFNGELNYHETEIQTSEVIEILTNNDVEMKTTNNSECESFTEMFNDEDISISKLSEIKIPIAIKKRGRPKGLEKTDIGLPKKKKISNKIPFINLNHHEKEKIMSWVMKNPNEVVNISSPDFIVHHYDIKEMNLINNKITEDAIVNVYYIRKYLTQEASCNASLIGKRNNLTGHVPLVPMTLINILLDVLVI